ncbi:hypothetical protein C6502_07925 [Candidatus Poribacteria bacterium]|nr:MAG: hypothetical protein C6502_07925 [Candidatus Poribacteria bacterium]
MNTDNKTIRRFRIKMAALLILKNILAFATVWGLLWGTVVIVLRATIGMPPLALLTGAIGLIVGIGCAVALALRHIPTRTALRASLDKHSGAGGLMMAAETVELGNWRRQMPLIKPPRLRWRGGAYWGRFLGAVLFVCISLLIPQRFVEISKAQPLDIREEVNELADGIDVLKEEEIIELAEAKILEDKLAQLQAEASGEDPVKTWESLDHLADTLSQEAADAAQDALSETERLTEAETLSEGLINEGSEMDAKLLMESMAALSGLVQEAAQENELFAAQLPDLAGDGDSLTLDQLKEISAALRLTKSDIYDRLVKLREVNLIDLETLKACEKLGQCNSDGLAAFLAENADSKSVVECISGWCRGIGRGPGHAPMTWSEDTTEEGAKFKAEALPLSDIASLEDSEIVGLSIGTPSVNTSSEPSQLGGLSGATTGGGSSFNQTVLPRHKRAVKRYFERP